MLSAAFAPVAGARAALATCVAVVALLAGCSADSPEPTGSSPAASIGTAAGPAASATITRPEVRALHARCTEAMVRSACIAQQDRSAPSQPAGTVLVAGVGAIDSKFYAQLRDAGDAMCGQVVQPCESRWDGAECRTARALWPDLPASAAPPGEPAAPVAAVPVTAAVTARPAD